MKDFYFFQWGLGIGDWGLGIGDCEQFSIPHTQSHIPNYQLPITYKNEKKNITKIKKKKYKNLIFFKKNNSKKV